MKLMIEMIFNNLKEKIDKYFGKYLTEISESVNNLKDVINNAISKLANEKGVRFLNFIEMDSLIDIMHRFEEYIRSNNNSRIVQK